MMTENVVRPSRRNLIGLIGATLLWPLLGRAAGLKIMSGTALGTTWRIAGPPGNKLERIRSNIDALFESIDRKMSSWRGDSTLSRINAGPAGWQTVDDLALAQKCGIAALFLVRKGPGLRQIRSRGIKNAML